MRKNVRRLIKFIASNLSLRRDVGDEASALQEDSHGPVKVPYVVQLLRVIVIEAEEEEEGRQSERQ